MTNSVCYSFLNGIVVLESSKLRMVGMLGIKRALLPQHLWLVDPYAERLEQHQPVTQEINQILRRKEIPKYMNRIMGIRLG